MSIISMKKLTLVAYGKDKARILRSIERTGCIEVSRTDMLERTVTREDVDRRDAVSDKLLRLQFALDFLKSEKTAAKSVLKSEKKEEKKDKNPTDPKEKLDYTPPKKKISVTPRIAFDEFYEVAEREPEIMEKIGELTKINSRYADIRAELTRVSADISQLKVFSGVNARLSSFADTKHTSVMLGTIPKTSEEIIAEIKKDFPNSYIEVGEGEKLVPVAAVSLKEETDALLERLNKAEFVRTTFTFDMTAQEMLQSLGAQAAGLNKEKHELLEKSLTYDEYLPEFRHLYDYYTIENARIKASDGFALTKSTFVLEGWYPEVEEERVLTALNSVTDALVIETREPEDGDPVPTLVKNSKIVAPYQAVTNMYSPPNYHDIDPNPYVAFFYFLMFGIMMGDAVYGILLAIGGFGLYLLKKPVPGKGKILLIIGMGGISTFIWGVLFGGWMGFDVTGTFLEKLIWFKPIDETNSNTAIYMLGLSLAVGVIQINFGMALHAYDLIKRKKIADAFCEVFSWYSILVGIILLALNMLIFKNVEGLKIAGIVFAVLGVALMLALGGIHKKGIGKIFGGLPQLYNGLNFLSDILSYSRLFGLGLATTVIGMVVNEICKVIISILTINGVAVLGVIVAAPIFLIGHTFNVGINTLGTYVHNSRLQFIEFFGRFYSGGGHVFKPLGSDTKYTYIEK